METINAFEILKERGFIDQTTDEKAITNLFATQKVVFYIGFDPSAPSLHVGNLEQLMAIKILHDHGHQPVVLIGGGTGLVGDPSDKDKERPLNSLTKVKENATALEAQISAILKNDRGEKILFLNNAKWLKKINYLEFLREVGKHFSINRLLTIDWIKNRLKTGLSFLEFNYQLLQAYDFWYLFKNYDCQVQLGGRDQWSNIVAGIELIRRTEEKEAYGLTLPLLTTASGKKMGKSEQGAVWLDPELTSPYEYYQFWINVDDKDVKKFLGLFTLLTMEEIKKLSRLKGENLKQAKEMLAFEATKIIHGEIEAGKAMEASRAIFRRGEINAESVPTSFVKKEKIKYGIPVFKLFVQAELCKSGSEATRLVKQGGAYLNGEKILDFELLVKEEDFKNGSLTLQAGKKKFHRLKLI